MLSRLITLQSLCSLSRRLHFRPVLMYSVLLSIGLQVAWADQSPCSIAHPRLPPVSPVYRDAMKLPRFLQSRGLVVDCVLLSTEERMFEGIHWVSDESMRADLQATSVSVDPLPFKGD
jgi:hypothetical protein